MPVIPLPGSGMVRMDVSRACYRWLTSTFLMNQTRKRALLFASVVVLVLLYRAVTWTPHKPKPQVFDEHSPIKFAMDSEMAMSWEGFGAEKGQYNFTVVTAMMDIGRGNWPHQQRSYNEYLLHMMRVLRLDVNFVIFMDTKGRPFIEWMRRGRESRTHIVEVKLEDLPYYPYKDRVQEIMNSAEYRKDNELVQQNLCESREPVYNILQWSKLYFMDEAIKMDPYKTDFFFWLDGGYGHGNDIHPADGIWKPKNIFNHPNKVTFMEREPLENYRDKIDHIHKLAVSVIAGLFFAGDKTAFKRLYELQQELLADWFKQGITDDDQTTYMLMYYKHPELFHFVPGDWDDVFLLFN